MRKRKAAVAMAVGAVPKQARTQDPLVCPGCLCTHGEVCEDGPVRVIPCTHTHLHGACVKCLVRWREQKGVNGELACMTCARKLMFCAECGTIEKLKPVPGFSFLPRVREAIEREDGAAFDRVARLLREGDLNSVLPPSASFYILLRTFSINVVCAADSGVVGSVVTRWVELLHHMARTGELEPFCQEWRCDRHTIKCSKCKKTVSSTWQEKKTVCNACMAK